jgi:hypothetical protein
MRPVLDDQDPSKSSSSSPTTGEPPGIRRRAFLQYLGAVFAASALPEALGACGETAPAHGDDGVLVDEEALIPSSRIDVVRAADLLTLSFGLVNLQKAATGQLTPIRVGQPCYLVVDYPPQIVAETPCDAADDPAPSAEDARLPQARSKIGGPSRVVFRLPDAFASADYSLSSLLALCSSSAMVVPAGAVQPAPAAPSTTVPDPLTALANGPIDRALAAEDSAAGARLLASGGGSTTGTVYRGVTGTGPLGDKYVTWIELPHRLLLAPNGLAAWGHATGTVASSSGRVELWHSYLGARDPVSGRIDEHNGFLRTACAVGTRDDDAGLTPRPPAQGSDVDPTWPIVSLSPTDRRQIVQLTTGTSASPIRLGRLMLSALGGYIDAHADFIDPVLTSWVHKAAQGREYDVELTGQGYLLPFGHQATLLQVTKRNDDPNRQVGLYEQHNVLFVRRALRSYRDADVQPSTRGLLQTFPFVACELQQTRFLTNLIVNQNGWVQDVAGNTIAAPFVGYDRRGRAVKFSVPLYFMGGDPRSTSPSALRDTYGGVDVAIDGQRVAYAPSSKDDTTFETSRLHLSLQPAPDEPFGAVPTASSIALQVEAIRQLVGNGAVTVEYDGVYAKSGFNPDANKGERLFVLTSGAVQVNFSARGGGTTGFVAPNQTFNAISRKNGPINAPPMPTSASMVTFAGLDAAASLGGLDAGAFSPSQFLDGALGSTKLFGAVPLLDLVQSLLPGAASSLDHAFDQAMNDVLRYAPKFVTETLHTVEKILAAFHTLKDRLLTLYEHAGDLGSIASDAGLLGRFGSIEKKLQDQISTYATQATTALGTLQSAARTLFDASVAVATDIEHGDVVSLTGLSPTLTAPPNPPSPTHVDAFTAAVRGVQSALGAFASLPPVPPQVKQVLGTVFAPIDAVLADVTGAIGIAAGYVADVRNLVAQLVAAQQGLEMVRDMKVRLEWRPKLQKVDVGGVAFFAPAVENGLLLAIEVRAKANGAQPAGADVLCRMDRFALRLGADNDNDAALSLKFDRCQLSMAAGKKPDIDVVFHGLTFGGPLSFVETLRQLIPLDGFSDPPHLDVDASGIRAGFSQALPNLAVGMFSLENIKLSADLYVPFLGADPLTFTFAFCDKDHPFLVTVAMLGGGGYFKLVAKADGLDSVEAAVFAAAELGIDLVVASASVSIRLGLSYTLKKTDGSSTVTLSGYVQLHGQLEVLGLISISLDVTLELTYVEPGCVYGRATLHVDVDVLFFSAGVDLTFERRFAGANGDPTLDQLLSPYVDPSPWWDTRTDTQLAALGVARGQVVPWADYVGAFA